MQQPKTPYVVFVDLESTGTNFDKDFILETGAIAVDGDFNELSRFQRTHTMPGQPHNIGTWDGWIAMHEKSGLIVDSMLSFFTPTRVVDVAFCDWLYSLGYSKENQAIMAGHSIGVFDQPMVKKQMPLSGALFSHRTLDFGAITRYVKHLGLDCTDPDEMPHRSMPDCVIELGEARALTAQLKRAIQTQKTQDSYFTSGEYLDYFHDRL